MIGATIPAVLVLSALLQGAQESLAFDSPQDASEKANVVSELLLSGARQQQAPSTDSSSPTSLNALVGQYRYVLANAGSEQEGLGLTLENVNDVVRKQLKLQGDQGLVVTGVTPGGPAERVGIQAEDILLSLNNQPLEKPTSLESVLKEAIRDSVVPLALLRAGKHVTIQVKPRYRVTLSPVESEAPQLYIGVRTTPVDGLLRTHLALTEGQGIVVTSVVDESPAQHAGIREGDLLLEANQKPLTDTDTLAGAVKASEGKAVSLAIVREGQRLKLDVTPGPRPPSEAASEPQATWIYELHPRLQYYPQPLLDLQLQQKAVGDYQRLANLALTKPVTDAAEQDRIQQLTKEVEDLRKQVEALKAALDKK